MGDYGLDLGPFQRPITTQSPETQQWFNRGLLHCFGFNHEEASRCFLMGLTTDPSCAMCYWGISFANGVNYNKPNMDDDQVTCVVANIRKACAGGFEMTPVERALVEALFCRYQFLGVDPKISVDQISTITKITTDSTEIPPGELAYSNAMRLVYEKFPDDVDIASLYVESLMNLRPWKLWTKEGKPEPDTLTIVETLEKAIEKYPPHPGIYHLYIHAMELSPYPEKALYVSNQLPTIVPEAGHLLHMPSHIYVLLGKYEQAIINNLKGIAADLKYVEIGGTDNFYTLYRCHNYHFVIYAAMFDGQFKVAHKAAQDLKEQLTPQIISKFTDALESFISIPLHVLIRFGKWSEILSEPIPTDSNLYSVTITMLHYARGLAYAATNRLDDAAEEKRRFDDAYANVPESRGLFNNKCRDILAIAGQMLSGELEYRRGDYEKAFRHLEAAVLQDDNLPYDEPWGWMQPARHALGALLLEQGHVTRAESVYRQDLENNPENCWSLHGLAECLRRQGEVAQAEEVLGRFGRAKQRADVPINASCYCRLSVLDG